MFKARLKYRALFLSSFAALYALFGACEKLPAFQPPSIEASKVRLKTLHHNGFDFDILVKAQNENPFEIFADQVSYRVFVDGQEVSKSERSERIEIKAGGARSVTLAMKARYENVDATWKRMKGKSEWRWEVKGELGFETPVGTLAMPFYSSDAFAAPIPPTFRFTNPRVKRIDLRGATLAFSVQVENPNTFELPSGEAGLKLEIMKRTFNLAAIKIPNIQAHGAHRFEVEERLSARELSKNIMNALTRPSVKANLKGDVKMGAVESLVDFPLVFQR